MLDDLKLIHERDAQDALGIVERQWQQLGQAFEVMQPPIDADNIVYAGMGSSALAAEMVLGWAKPSVPVQIVRDYDTPEYVSARTYFIASSYSGNTEETLSSIAQAEARGAQIAVIAAGGKLAQIAREKGYPLIILPKVEQPRFALLSNLKALVVLLTSAGLLNNTEALAELERSATFLRESVQAWLPTVPAAKNQAKQIALEVIGKSAVIYSGTSLAPAAYKWKIGFNENAKHVAWTNQLPEFSHNEFMGWTKQPVQKPYAVIDIRSSLDNPRVTKRFELSERLLSGLRPAPIIVEPSGQDLLEQLLWTMTLGDFVTIYTALLNGLNPTPVELVEKFKKQMEDPK
ncbi:MAG: bifunctional phosphoglucose/phosphomannose isomerase [Candidatus Saccharibacteria bacterium]|nr:bifunctional phosphoglucose/phosphomannose isomerase [Candidatus Saccharibacteria bacterium]